EELAQRAALELEGRRDLLYLAPGVAVHGHGGARQPAVGAEQQLCPRCRLPGAVRVLMACKLDGALADAHAHAAGADAHLELRAALGHLRPRRLHVYRRTALRIDVDGAG